MRCTVAIFTLLGCLNAGAAWSGERTIKATLVSSGSNGGEAVLDARLQEESSSDLNQIELLAAAGRSLSSGATPSEGDRILEIARAVYWDSNQPSVKFEAALLAANVKIVQRKLTGAQIWLRAALQAAPTEKAREQVESLYREVVELNDLRLRFSLSLSPSNNVNNGSQDDVVLIGGLPFRVDDRDLQLSGYRASSAVSLSYKISESSVQRTEVIGEAFYHKIWLDQASESRFPNLEASSFDSAGLSVGIRQLRLIWPQLGVSDFAALMGVNWYGGEVLSNWALLAFSQQIKINERNQFQISLSVRENKREDGSINNSSTIGGSLTWGHVLGNGNSMAVTLFAEDVSAQAATIDSLALGVAASWRFAKVGPLKPSISIRGEIRDYRKWQAIIPERIDETVAVTVAAELPDIEYFGFSPEVRVEARQTTSDVSIYDRREIALGFRLVSQF